MTEFEKKHPDTVALLKRLDEPSVVSVPKPEKDPTSTEYKGVLLIIWLIGMIFVAVPYFAGLYAEPDGTPGFHMKIP